MTLDKGDQFSLLRERHVYQVQLEALEEEREEEDVALETSRKLPAWMIEIDEEVEPYGRRRSWSCSLGLINVEI